MVIKGLSELSEREIFDASLNPLFFNCGIIKSTLSPGLKYCCEKYGLIADTYSPAT